MKLNLELDAWDLVALIALLLVTVGLFAWHWPAALVVLGAGYLLVYYRRETHLAAQPPAPGSDRPGE